MKGWARVPIKRIWSDFSVAFQKIIFLVIHFGIKNGKTLVSNNKSLMSQFLRNKKFATILYNGYWYVSGAFQSKLKYITYVGVFEQHEKLHCIAKYSNTLKEMKCTRISVFASRRGVQFFSLSNWLFCGNFLAAEAYLLLLFEAQPT